MQYAIDFGTSNTVITRWNRVTEKAEIVKITNITGLQDLIPSLLFIKDRESEDYLIGQQVRNEGLDIDNNVRFFSNFKRGIGCEIQGFLPELEGETITLEKVGAYFLGSLVKKLNPTPTSVILTVPVDSYEAYRIWLINAYKAWNIQEIKLLDEPTAAALGYEQLTAKIVMVFDFGGGTLDISIVDLGNSKENITTNIIPENSQFKRVKIIAKGGINLGGIDIDNWLFEYFHKKIGLRKSSFSIRLVERLKIKLSQEFQANEFYFNNENLETYELNLNQGEFVEILEEHGFIKQIENLINQVLLQAKFYALEKDDVDAVLLVGGSAQIPLVKSCLKNYFEESKIYANQALDAIAKGALQLGQTVKIDDILSHGYAIRFWNQKKNCHSWHTFIRAGQSYPTMKPFELILAASLPNQSSLELIVGELGQKAHNTEVYFQGNQLVTSQISSQIGEVRPLNEQDSASTVIGLNPVGKVGIDRLKIKLLVDQERFLRITVEDLLTNEILLDNQIVIRCR
jgi:molecular chaperone DnaK (HSP70)